MTIAAAAATILLMLFVGLVLNQALRSALCRLDGVPAPSGAAGVFEGLMPGLALVGGIGTMLAAAGLFTWSVLAAMAAACLLLFFRSSAAVGRALPGLAVSLIRDFGRGRFLEAVAFLLFLFLLGSLGIAALVPSDNADVWVFQVPLAMSLIDHGGVKVPQIDHNFYGNTPLFFHVLFAIGMMAIKHSIGASLTHIAVFLSFILFLVSFSERAKALTFFAAAFLVAGHAWFAPGATLPMTDIARSCFSAAAVLFAFRFVRSSRTHDLAAAALVGGGAVGGKYSELLVVAFIGLGLLPLLLRQVRDLLLWRQLLIAMVAFLFVGGYWYVRNAYFLGNPIHPFLFGHVGLTDTWMAEYMLELGRAFDPRDRIYVTDITQLAGWRDYGFILWSWFIENRPYTQAALAIVLVGALMRLRGIAFLIFMIMAMFTVWYFMMFNHVRWALPAYLTLQAGAVVVVAVLWDRVAAAGMSFAGRLPGLLRKGSVVVFRVAAAGAIVVGATHVVSGGIAKLPVDGEARKLLSVFAEEGGVESYLNRSREGYALYQYIAEHDLAWVWQPYDSSADQLASAYNGGRTNRWIRHWRRMPVSLDDIDDFLAREDIHYFINRGALLPVAIERLGPDHVDLAQAVIDRLLPRSTLVFEDGLGWRLYRVGPAGRTGPAEGGT